MSVPTTLCVGATASATTLRDPSAASVTRALRPRPPAGIVLVRSLGLAGLWAREGKALGPLIPPPQILAVLGRGPGALLLKCPWSHGSIMGPPRVGKEGRFQLRPAAGTLARLLGEAWPRPTSRGSKHINEGSTLLPKPQGPQRCFRRMCRGKNPSSLPI